jgi:hypothetical protein
MSSSAPPITPTMTPPDSTTLDQARSTIEPPPERVVDKVRVLAHLRQQLAECAAEEGADHGDA